MTFINGEQHQINQVYQGIVNELIELQTENNLDNYKKDVNHISGLLTGMIKLQPWSFEGALEQMEILYYRGVHLTNFFELFEVKSYVMFCKVSQPKSVSI